MAPTKNNRRIRRLYKMTENKRFASVHDFVIGECEMFEGTFCDKEKPNGKCLRCDEEWLKTNDLRLD